MNYDHANSAASTVAAVHYARIVGEPQDNDLAKSMSINSFQTKLTIMGLTKEKLMIDSGAQCCVCPLNYAPEIEMVKVDRRELPELHSVTGAAMKVEGVKYIMYRLAGHHEMRVRYYVTDVGGPILSVNGLNQSGYSPVLSEKPYLEQFKHYITELKKESGLYYLISMDRSKANIGQEESKRLIAGTTSSDYWKLEGDKAIRVHLKPRRFKFTPTTESTCPGNGKENGPWLHRLGSERVTKVRLLRDPTNEIVLEENWMHAASTNDIGEKWLGEYL